MVETRHPRIVVVGGGYAGVVAAQRAARLLGAGGEVLLVSAEDALIERIRLHEAVVHGRDVRVPLARLFAGTTVRLRRGFAGDVDLAKKTITVDGERIDWDRLILALGSATDTSAVPGAREHAFTLDLARVPALRARITDLSTTGGRVVIVGGGLTGIELGAEIAESHPKLSVTLVCDSVGGPDISVRGRDYLRRSLARLGVTVREGLRVSRIDADSIVAGDERIAADVCVWSGGFVASPLIARFGLATNARGQALVDPRLRAVGHEHVYVAGDAAIPAVDPGHNVVMSCRTAMPLGAHAASNAVASLRNHPEAPFDLRDTGRCISLGRRDGLIQVTTKGGTPSARIFTGRLGAWIKELVCRFTVLAARAEKYRVFRYRWLRTGRAPAALPADNTQLLPEPLGGALAQRAQRRAPEPRSAA